MYHEALPMSVFIEILPSFHSSIVVHSLHKGPKTYLTRTHLIDVWFPDFFSYLPQYDRGC